MEDVAQIASEAIEEVLDVHLEDLDGDSSFLDLGFDSLSLTRFATRLGERLGIELLAPQILEYPNVAALCAHLARERGPAVSVPRITVAGAMNRQAAQPLSFAQRQLWSLVQFEEGASRAYNMPVAARFTGRLDRRALRAALDRIVARHESLRARFVMVDDEPAQIIAAESSGFALRELEWSPGSGASLQDLLRQDAGAEFDLESGPLLRGVLIRLSDDEHVLQVTMHHLVTDGWSIGVLLRELQTLYSAFCRGDPDPLPPLDVQYPDYVRWQREWLQGERLARQKQFWRETLEGAPTLLTLPTDRPRAEELDYTGENVEVQFDSGLTAGLKTLSQRHQVTLYTTVLMAWATLLSRLSGQQEVVIGTPNANRSTTAIEQLIGFFVNTLAIRVPLTGNPSFAALLRRVNEQVRRAQAHADLPFDQVVKVLNPPRSLAHAPVFQVMFAWMNLPETILVSFQDLQVQLFSASAGTAQFDLALTLRESGGQITGTANYSTALFDRQTLERHLEQLRRLLEAMVSDDSQRVNQ